MAKTTIDYLIDTDKPQPQAQPQVPPPAIQRSLSNIDNTCGLPPKSIESEAPMSTQNPNSVDSGLGNENKIKLVKIKKIIYKIIKFLF